LKTTNLRKLGNSQGVILDKSVLELTDSTSPDTVFKITIHNNSITLTPLSAKEIHDKAMDSAKKVSKTQRNVLDNLAR